MYRTEAEVHSPGLGQKLLLVNVTDMAEAVVGQRVLVSVSVLPECRGDAEQPTQHPQRCACSHE